MEKHNAIRLATEASRQIGLMLYVIDDPNSEQGGGHTFEYCAADWLQRFHIGTERIVAVCYLGQCTTVGLDFQRSVWSEIERRLTPNI